MAREVSEPWTELPAHLPAATPFADGIAAAAFTDTLTLRDGDADWALAGEDVLFVAEPAACLTPIPHAPATVRGLACIEGRPFAVVDTAADPADRTSGGALVVVASGDGGVALRVDAAGHKGSGMPMAGARPDVLSGLAPWAPPAAGRREIAAPASAAATIPLLLVRCGDVDAALSVTTANAGPRVTVERVGMVGSRQQLRAKGVDALVRVDELLLPARSLADALPIPPARRSGEVGERWAVVLGFDGQQAALLVDRVIGVTACDPRQILAMLLPGGTSQLWLDRCGGEAVPVVDPAALFGWPADAVLPLPSGLSAGAEDVRAEAVLTVQAEDVGLALPLALIDRVLEPDAAPTAERTTGALPVFDAAVALGRRSRPRCGTLIRLMPEGSAPFVLSVDRTAVIVEAETPWLTAEPLPLVAALTFDAVGLAGEGEEAGGRWVFRLRCRLPLPSALPMTVRRSLAAARLGWVAPGSTPVRARHTEPQQDACRP